MFSVGFKLLLITTTNNRPVTDAEDVEANMTHGAQYHTYIKTYVDV